MSLNLLYPGYESRTEYCGQLLISGAADMGAAHCFQSVLDDFMNEPGPVILFTADAGYPFREDLRVDAAHRSVLFRDLSWDIPKEFAFDLLSAASTAPEQAALCVRFILDDTDGPMFDLAQRLLRDAILACDISGEYARFRNVLNWDPDSIREIFLRSRELGDRFRQEEMRFLATDTANSCWMELNTHASLLDRETVDLLSGDLPVRELFVPGTLTLLQIPSGITAENRSAKRFFNGMAELVLHQAKVMNHRKECWHAAIYNGAGIPPIMLRRILELTADAQHLRVPLCMYQENISEFLNTHGESIVGRFGCYAVFCTLDGAFWSRIFGSSLRPEISHIYGNGKAATQRMRGGVVAHPVGKKDTISISRVEKPNYEPRAFSDLRRNAFLWYLVRDRRRGLKNWR